ncbi:MAG: DUF3943 domain-containing protein [Gammaproteobacteria bacterium]|jgi:hypothetical protein|nr:DUF3943 domain-containing protein [Gammaproteobacteria bacterium]
MSARIARNLEPARSRHPWMLSVPLFLALLLAFMTVSAAPQRAPLRLDLPPLAAASDADQPNQPHSRIRPVAASAPPDAAGLRRDTWYFLGGQLLIIGALYVGPERLSGWSDEQKEEYSLNKYRDNVRQIVVDHDRWWVNYILHPYWGGAYYVRARERGFDDDTAFWYSALLSAVYEFGAEAFFEEPSVQDLIFTPTLGYFVGHQFMKWRGNILQRQAIGETPGFGSRALLLATDPLGAVSRLFDRALGIEGELTMLPFYMEGGAAVALTADGPARPDADPSLLPGLQVQLIW